MKLRHRLCAATLLFPAPLFAQTAAPTANSAPSTAGSSVSSPVMSTAAKNRAGNCFGYFESGQTAQLYPAFSGQLKKSGGGDQAPRAVRR